MQNAGLLDDYVVFANVSLAAFILSGIGYSIASYRLLNRYRRLTDQNFAFRKSIDLSWLKFFIYGSAGIFSFVSVITVLDEFTNINFGFNAELIFYTLLILFILYLGYSGIRHQSIFSGEPETDNQVVTPPAEESGYTRSGLNDEEGKRHHANLIELMSTKKPYLEPKLSLSELADQLDISPNHLSQVINQFEEKNFFDFINAYRVNEFKTRALKPENKNYSILAIAYDSGFNSKSTFNHVFKKMEGSTPSAYLKSAKSA
jgi:AraC-like DNA-binding protein